MFATATIVLPEKPPVVTIPETAVDYTLYGDSVFLITEKKGDDGKTTLTADRTFVKTGNRVEGRVEILKGLKAGDKVVAVGQIKLQSGHGGCDLDRSAAAGSGRGRRATRMIGTGGVVPKGQSNADAR